MRANAFTRVLSVIAAALAMIANPMPASAQDWPTRVVTLVVPFAASGGTDVMARILADPMAEILGQDVIVENVTGASGMVGSAHVARAQPDGYTILFGSRSAAIDAWALPGSAQPASSTARFSTAWSAATCSHCGPSHSVSRQRAGDAGSDRRVISTICEARDGSCRQCRPRLPRI
jgi:Tripartite tricarboxylate transporter family receptor